MARVCDGKLLDPLLSRLCQINAAFFCQVAGFECNRYLGRACFDKSFEKGLASIVFRFFNAGDVDHGQVFTADVHRGRGTLPDSTEGHRSNLVTIDDRRTFRFPIIGVEFRNGGALRARNSPRTTC